MRQRLPSIFADDTVVYCSLACLAQAVEYLQNAFIIVQNTHELKLVSVFRT